MAKVLWLDLETTGLDPHKNGIVEIAAVVECDGVETDSFQSYVRPDPRLAISAQALEVCHIDDLAQLDEFPKEVEVAASWINWLDGIVDRSNRHDRLILGGFNVDFDRGFLEQFLRRHQEHWLSFFRPHLLDVRAFTTWALRDRFDVMPNGKLMSCAEAVLSAQELTDALSGGVAHGASVDIRVTIEMFRKLINNGVQLQWP